MNEFENLTGLSEAEVQAVIQHLVERISQVCGTDKSPRWVMNFIMACVDKELAHLSQQPEDK